MKLRIFANDTNTEFRIGWDDEDFHMCSTENLKDCMTHIRSEKEITAMQEKHGAVTEYYDFRKDKECTKEEYDNHFINYDSDKSHIVATSTFSTKEQAEKCLMELESFQ